MLSLILAVRVGLLIVNSDLSTKGISSVLYYAAFIVSEKLYILLRSHRCQKRCEYTWKKCISQYYSSASYVICAHSCNPFCIRYVQI